MASEEESRGSEARLCGCGGAEGGEEECKPSGSLEESQRCQGERVRREDGAVENWKSLYLEFELLRYGICTFHEATQLAKLHVGDWRQGALSPAHMCRAIGLGTQEGCLSPVKKKQNKRVGELFRLKK